MKRQIRNNGIRRASRSGFTLIELLVVCVIIGVLAAIALSKLQNAFLHARVGQAISNAKTVERAAWMYKTIKGQLPVIAGDNALTSASPFCDQIGEGRWTGGSILCDYMKQWINQVPENRACGDIGTYSTYVWNSDPNDPDQYPRDPASFPADVQGGYSFNRSFGFVMMNCGDQFPPTGQIYYEMGQSFTAATRPTTGRGF